MFDKKNIENIKTLKQQQKLNVEQNKDDYSVGLYNGIELCLSLLEKREPEFLFTISNVETKTQEQMKRGRTVASGICKRK